MMVILMFGFERNKKMNVYEIPDYGPVFVVGCKARKVSSVSREPVKFELVYFEGT